MSETQESGRHLHAIYAKIALIAAKTNGRLMKFRSPSDIDDHASGPNVIPFAEAVARKRKSAPSHNRDAPRAVQ
jgi:hypothetical protein